MPRRRDALRPWNSYDLVLRGRVMLHKDFRDFLALLAEHKVRHLVVGGYAVAVHGYPRYTGDLDIFIALDPSTAEAVTAAFIDFGFSDADINADTFLIPKSIVEVGHEPLKLHVMNSISGVAFDEAYANRQTVQTTPLNKTKPPAIGCPTACPVPCPANAGLWYTGGAAGHRDPIRLRRRGSLVTGGSFSTHALYALSGLQIARSATAPGFVTPDPWSYFP